MKNEEIDSNNSEESQDIAIIGMAGRFPGAENIDQFWTNLRNGVESIRSFTDEELTQSGVSEETRSDPSFVNSGALADGLDTFDAAFFGISPREAEVMDPQHRVFLETAWEALENAGYDPEAYQGLIGIFGGVAPNTYRNNILNTRPELLQNVGDYLAMISTEKEYAVTRVGFKLNFRGPCVSVNTACSTSGVALHLACQSLLSGETDICLVGGCRIRAPLTAGYIYTEDGIPSPDGHCRTFDADAQGTAIGNGAGMIVVKRLADAQSDNDHIYAVVKSTAINNDGNAKIGFTAPGVQGQAAVIAEALALAGITADKLQYVEAHGTGTKIGDPIEIAALTKAFRQTTDKTGFCAIGSVKTNIGHLDAGAAVVGVIKTALALQHKELPASLHFKSPNPQIDFQNSPFFVNSELRPWQQQASPRRAGVSSFGLGGTNFHVVLEESRQRKESGPAKETQILTISAKTENALNNATMRLGKFLECKPELNLADVAYTLQEGRRRFEYRRILVCNGIREATQALLHEESSGFDTKAETLQSRDVVFMFPGGGAQYAGMGRGLYETEQIFRESVDQSARLIQSENGYDIRRLLTTDESLENSIADSERPSIALPFLFAIEYALAELWQGFGIIPVAMIGHSMGEYVAACVAGVITREQALKLVILRGRLFETLPPGGMLSIPLSPDDAEKHMPASLDFAAINRPDACVISGDSTLIEEMRLKLESLEIPATRVHISVAAHSNLVEPILDEFRTFVDTIPFKNPEIPYISNVTGDWISSEEVKDSNYWVRHLRQTVQFSIGLTTLFEDPERAFLEIGPGRTLSTFVLQHRDRSNKHIAISSLRHPNEEMQDDIFLLRSLGRLWMAGLKVDWTSYHGHTQRQRVPLPTYPFERIRYWAEVGIADSDAPSQQPQSPLQPQPALLNTQPVQPQPEKQAMPSRYDFIADKLMNIFHEMSGLSPDEIKAAKSFLDMGLDSLFLTQANLKIKKQFNVKVTFRQLFDDAPNLNALAVFIDNQLPAEALKEEIAASVQNSLGVADAIPGAPSQPDLIVASQLGSGQSISGIPGMQPLHNPSALQQAIMLQIQASNALLQIVGSNGTAITPQVASSIPAAAQNLPGAIGNEPEETRAEFHEEVSDKEVRALSKALGPYKPLDHSPSSFKLTDQASQALQQFIKDYSIRTAKSKALANDQRKFLSDARSISGFRHEWKEITYQLASGSGSKGSRIYDVDGNEYVDVTSGFGINLFGYSPDWLIEAAHKQLDEGIELGTLSPKALEAARLVREITGMDRCTFTNTGSEAISAAIRAARTTTGKDMIAVFRGEYHGITDELLVNMVNTNNRRKTVPTSPGIPQSLVQQVIVLEWDDPSCLNRILYHADELAAVIIEPVQNRNPALKTFKRFAELREITKDNEIALIYDEIITGFRLAPGGAQQYFGVEADMACYGKIMGGGMPSAMVAGRGDFLDCFDGGPWQFGDDSFPEAGVTFFGGTYTRHPMALATTVAALHRIKEFGQTGYDQLNLNSRNFSHRLNALLISSGFPARVESCESIFNLKFNDDNPYSRMIFWQLRHRGVYIDDRPFFITAAHSQADFNFILAQFEASIHFLQSTGIVSICSASGEYGTENIVPFNMAQAEVYIVTELGEAASKAFHEQVIYHFDEPLNLPVLTHALQKMIYKHDALRTRVNEDGDAFIIAPALFVPLDIETVVADGDESTKLDSIYRRNLTAEFDLRNGPLIRFRILRLTDADGAAVRDVLLVTTHHLIIDGWSMSIILKDLANAYNLLLDNDRCQDTAENQLADFLSSEIEFRASSEFELTEAFWQKTYEGDIPDPVQLPQDNARPLYQSFKGARHEYHLGKDLTEKIRQLSVEKRCTRFTLLFTLFTQWLFKVTGQSDIAIAVPMAGQAIVGMPELVGHSVNFLPLRVHLDSNETFEQALLTNRSMVMEINDNQRYTYLDLLKTLDIKRDPGQPPLVPISFNVDQRNNTLSFGNLIGRFEVCPRDYVKNDMFFNLIEEGDEFTLELDRNSDIFTEQTVNNWVKQFKEFCEIALSNPAVKPSQIILEGVADQRQQLAQWNDTDRNYEVKSRTLISLFEAAADLYDDQTAIVFEGESLSYLELDRAANQVANYLIHTGIKIEDRVALILDRSFEMLIGIYGVLKAGAAYVPLDSDQPTSRLQGSIDDSGAKYVLLQSQFQSLVKESTPALALDDINAPHRSHSHDRPDVEIGPENLAYVIYTSGTTGNPKGVMNEHRAVVNRLLWGQEHFAMSAGDRHIQKTPYTFDVSVPELFWPLQIGATLILPRPDGHKDVDYLYELLQDEKINFVHFVPSMLHAFLQHEALWELPMLRQVHCTGEPLTSALRDKLFEKLPGVRLFNLYGPTEAAVEVSYWECEPKSTEIIVPIGKPIANTQLYILDEALKPVFPGAVGELYIGGVQLARGYLNQPDLTRERFINTVITGQETRLYKTGDLAKFRMDGVIEFLGRNDAQIKLRGYRIELGEIESALAALPEVLESAAAVQSIDQADQRLIGFVQFVEGQALSSVELKRNLALKLPAYMIPQFFVVVEAIPYTSSGKLDRNQLLKIMAREFQRTSARKPSSSSEIIVARIWSDFIRIDVDQISTEDNFFDIGGHSLLAMEVIRKVNKIFGKRLILRDILYNTLEVFCLMLPEFESADLETRYRQAQLEQAEKSSKTNVVSKIFGIFPKAFPAKNRD